MEKPSKLSNTARNVLSRARVLFHVDDTSDALFEWKTHEHSLCHCFTFLRLLICLVGLFCSPPSFHTSPSGKLHSLWKMSFTPHSYFLPGFYWFGGQWLDSIPSVTSFNYHMPSWQQWDIKAYTVGIAVWASLRGLRLLSARARASSPPEGSDISPLVWSNSGDRQ